MVVSRRALFCFAAMLPSLPVLASTSLKEVSVSVDTPIEWGKPYEQMSLAELESVYEHMMRNCSMDMRKKVESPQKIEAADWFCSKRQEVYRLICQKKYGIIYAKDLNGMLHHPV